MLSKLQQKYGQLFKTFLGKQYLAIILTILNYIILRHFVLKF